MTTKTATILVTAAAAATAAATIAVSAPVKAVPPAPQAPACAAWTHNGGLNINQDNGLILQIDNWLGNSAGTGQDNAKLLRADGTPVLVGGGWAKVEQTGRATGGNTGNKFDLTVVFAPGFGDVSNHYTGTIDDMGTVSGTTTNSKGVTNGFLVQEHFTCASQGAPAPAPNSDKPVRCTGGYTLPPGSDCGKTPNPNPPAAPPPPSDAVSLTFGKPGLAGLPVTATNTSPVSGSCKYKSTPFDYEHDFPIQAHGSVEWTIGAPKTGINYHVTLTCSGPYQGQTIEFGHVDTTKTY